jgi:hypothetical protein
MKWPLVTLNCANPELEVEGPVGLAVGHSVVQMKQAVVHTVMEGQKGWSWLETNELVKS